VKLIGDKYISSNSTLHPLDLALVSQYFTLDVITGIAFGEPFGYLAKDEDVYEYVRTTDEIMPAIALASVFPALRSFINMKYIRNLVLPSTKDRIGLGRVMKYVL
jgi:hypothetical protein